MNYRYIPIIWPLLGSGLLTLSLGIFAQLKHRKEKGAGFFAISMFVVTLWSIPNALELTAKELPVKIFWANVQYFAYCLSPVFLLLLCLEFTGYMKRISKKNIVWLVLIPCITLLLIWTNRWHGLMRYDIYLDDSGVVPVIGKKYGSWFYVHALYSHCLNLCAIAVLAKTVLTKVSVYRKQALQLLVGICFIVIPNLFYISGISPFRFDITPVFFGPAGVIMLWSIFHNRMFELVPLARAAVIEAMEPGVMVTDVEDRVLDMNASLMRILGITRVQYYLKSLEEVCKEIPEMVRIMKDPSITHTDFTIEKEDARVYEILLTPLMDKKNYCIGRLAVIHDITHKKQAQQVYFQQQWRLAVIEERESMARDLHDNLGQVMGFINFQSQAIKQELESNGIGYVSDKLDRLIETAQNTHTQIREYITNIRTLVKKERDFISSLKLMIENFELQIGLKVKLEIPEDKIGKDLDSAVMVNVLNIIREAMNNIRKHAQANEVRILIQLDELQMRILIEDDGKGFQLYNSNRIVKDRFGLDIMKERAALFGGTVEIESAPGKGCSVTVSIPRIGGDKINANKSNAG